MRFAPGRPGDVGVHGAAAACGSLFGAWLMTEKLNRTQVKMIIGVVLLGIALETAWDLPGQ